MAEQVTVRVRDRPRGDRLVCGNVLAAGIREGEILRDPEHARGSGGVGLRSARGRLEGSPASGVRRRTDIATLRCERQLGAREAFPAQRSWEARESASLSA